MPSTVSRGLFAKYGPKLDQAVKKHAASPVEYGIIRLPGGIDNGIARLTKCGFEQFQSGTTQKTAAGTPAVGEYYFRAEGSICEPESIMTPQGRVKVYGLQTSVMVPVCDTKDSNGKVTTLEDHFRVILNHMKMLTSEEFVRGADATNLEELAAKIVELAPYFRFTTSQSAPTEKYPDPRVWENWHGNRGLDDYTEPMPESASVNDSSARRTTPAPVATPSSAAATPPVTNGPAPRTPAVPATRREQLDRAMAGKDGRGGKASAGTQTARAPTPPPPPPAAEPEPEQQAEEFSEFQNATEGSQEQIDELLERVRENDQDARDKLTDLAVAAGYSEQEVTEADSWDAVAEMITNPRNAATPNEADGEPQESTEPEPEVPPLPEPGQTCLYKPIDPKTKAPYIDARTKREKPPVSVEIMKVNTKNNTADLKSMVDRKTLYKGVPFDQLIANE